MHILDEAALLDSILNAEAIEVHFQPIVNIAAGRIHGYEALSRGPASSPLHTPFHLFGAAERNARLSELETLCRSAAIQQFSQRQLPGKLFINISPKALLDPDYPKGQTLRIAQQLGYSPSQIVIELSEQYPAEDIDLLKSCLDHYRNQGFQVALDDLGAGYSGLRLWSELAPDYVKIDRHFIDRIDQFPVKQEFVRSIVELCQSLTCKVIAEGIETDAELAILRRLGISLCQGFLLGRPATHPAPTIQLQNHHAPLLQQPRYNESAECLCEISETLPPTTRLKALSQHFMQRPALQAVAVIDGDKALGLVYRQSLLELFSTPYGRALHENHPITNIMDADVLMVEASEPLSHVSYQLTSDDNRYIAQQFIILRHGKFLGIGHTRDLLQRITEQRIQTARHANPLTELPGNVPIQQELQRLANSQTPFYLAYFDLNNFKPYNDVYGFAKGDEVIRDTANLLRRFGLQQFIGHVGGDDFVMIGTAERMVEDCQRILHEFERLKQRYFLDEHWQQQQFSAKDRQGQQCLHGLVSLSVGILPPELTFGADETQLSTLSAYAKKQAKLTQSGFCLLQQPTLAARQIA
ncbi:D-glycero-D-manno-heptose 1-phosphate guanosyltransferase [Shewanella mangrovi]|uniref:D-glycero-D-manno-heptose 1-phosphate guanosyltransferase n=1 Tax=Shewanella mangrovi TaxID=1515746 RepID=A0A094JWJ6_9GAMM|nr:GGDEF domain-containing protein [Shewanella mangrovi]KFZ36816.1 D-glycero-D-manno-heptose 1-phosphate guanosyltransferase [Shewanella mangrovi]